MGNPFVSKTCPPLTVTLNPTPPSLAAQVRVGRPPGAPALHAEPGMYNPVPVAGISTVAILGGVEIDGDDLAGRPHARDDDGLGPLVPLLEAHHDVATGHVWRTHCVAVDPEEELEKFGLSFGQT